MGADVQGEPELLVDRNGALGYHLQALLPDSGTPDNALLHVEEVWRQAGDDWERIEYAYELVDLPRNRRRAYHLHYADYFQAAYDVIVHEHCEEILGSPACSHYFGEPVTDGYRGIELLMLAWTEEPLGCALLRCLEGWRPLRQPSP